MKKTITTSLLMILMIIMNVNVKAQVLNNVITDKKSFGPVESDNVGINYVIIKDTLYTTGGTSLIKSQGTETMSFPNVVFMYGDYSRNNLYIATKDSGLYRYHTTDGILRCIKSFTNISSYAVNTNVANPRIFIANSVKILNIDLNIMPTSTVAIAIVGGTITPGIISLEFDNVNSNLICSNGSTLYTIHDVNDLLTSISSTSYTYTVNDMEFFNGNLYYATNNGVIVATSGSVVATGNYNIINSYNNNLYFAKSTGEIFKCDASIAVSPMIYSNTVNIVSKVNSITYVRSNDGTNSNNYYLWVGTDKGLFIDIAASIAADTTIFPVNRMMFNNLPNSYLTATGTSTATTTGIEESVLENTSGLYPVPNNGSFSYKTKYAGTLQIINISGQVVFEQKLEEGATKIEMSLDNGIYVAQFNCIQGKVSKKFMVIN